MVPEGSKCTVDMFTSGHETWLRLVDYFFIFKLVSVGTCFINICLLKPKAVGSNPAPLTI